mgnify:FL=1
MIILSAPSGCGKSTIIGEIIKNPSLNLAFSISATTRLPREGEKHGVNYYFLSVDEFQEAINNNELVEYEEVYPGRYYGTLKKEIDFPVSVSVGYDFGHGTNLDQIIHKADQMMYENKRTVHEKMKNEN